MRIAIQGELGSFSHEAALNLEPQATIVPCAQSAEVFKLVENAEVCAAVIPIENSLAGSVVEHFDLLFQCQVQIERESLLRIRHNLIGAPGSTVEGIRRVLSHPVALAQCRRFLSHHAKMSPTPFYDTAGSVKHVVEQGDNEAAAIASEQAALTYGGQVLASGIEDNAANYTRFFLIRRSDGSPPGGDKVSIAFTVENRPGTLVSALQVFADYNTNLCKVESRPVHGQPWQYVFYLDYQVSDPASTSAALDQLRRRCLLVKELGRYPAARPLS
jgi:prephenate dehydratase